MSNDCILRTGAVCGVSLSGCVTVRLHNIANDDLFSWGRTRSNLNQEQDFGWDWIEFCIRLRSEIFRKLKLQC